MHGPPVTLRAGRVVPAPDGLRAEQVGWGVARQVARSLAPAVGRAALLDLVPQLAEAPGHAAYAVFVERDAVALALLRLTVPEAAYLGHLLAPAAPPGTVAALLVRALHDAGAAGADRLVVSEPDVDLTAFGPVSDH